MSDEDFLSRWSRRKRASRAGPDRPAAEAIPAPASVPPPARVGAPDVPREDHAEPLPPVESLTPESDFTPFMRSEVDPGLRRQALRTLFRDPRFNVMDGLDVYIDDYSKPDPIPPEWIDQLVARLGDYHPPAEPERVPEGAPQDGADPKKQATEQHVASGPEQAASDTPASGSTPSKLKES